MIFIKKIKFVGLFGKFLTQPVSQHADEPDGLGRDFDVKDQLVEKRADACFEYVDGCLVACVSASLCRAVT